MIIQNTDGLVPGSHTNQPRGLDSAQHNPLVGEIRAIYSQWLTTGLQRLLPIVDDELFKRSEKADSSAQQSLYFGAMRHFRVRANELQVAFLRQLEEGYDEFWTNYQPPLFAEDISTSSQTVLEQDFSLVENEALEEEIAVSSMIDKGNNRFQDNLSALNRRLAYLQGYDDIASGDNPLSPKAICQAFCSALKPIFSELAITLLIYKLFDHIILGAAGELYSELNRLLVNAGILPTLPKNFKRHSATESAIVARGSIPSEDKINLSPDENQQAYVEVFQGMQQLLAGWRAQMGLPANEVPPGQIADARTVLNALNLMQAPQAGLGVYPTGVEGLKPYITEHLARIQPGEERHIARSEEDIIDMVALIFDFILEDQHMPDVVKGLIARLQIPVIKVAIIEKSFFGRKNHPVRLLLNALAQAGSSINSDEEAINSPAYKKIENVVNRILDEFDQNVGLFSDLLDEFMAFLEKDDQRSRVVEERARQTIQSKEQVHLAKRKIAYEIASRLEGKGTPTAVRSFLYNAWKDVLVLAYLRREKQPGEWETALAVMDKLIWSVLPPKDETSRKAIIHTIPRLLQAIRAGLEGISMDPASVSQTIKGLEACHLARLTNAAHAPEPGDDDFGIEIRDPEFAQAFSEVRNSLPDVENIGEEEFAQAEDYQAGGETLVQGEAFFKARELEIGQWLEFDDGRNKFKGKLSWKSEVTSTYVFINKKGAIVLEITLVDLARRIQDNSARAIKDVGVPLLDRAFSALMSQLKTPVPKPVL